MPKFTEEELHRYYQLMRSDPEQCLAMVNKLIEVAPADADNYFSRHHLWESLGRLDLALQDLNTCIGIEAHYVSFESRGWLLCQMGRYEEALADFNRAEAMAPEEWKEGFGPRLRANCHAHLGNVEGALADCASLPEDFWLPAMRGMPAGAKQEYTIAIRRRAEAARQIRASGDSTGA